MEKTTNEEITPGRVMAVIPDGPPAHVLWGACIRRRIFPLAISVFASHYWHILFALNPAECWKEYRNKQK